MKNCGRLYPQVNVKVFLPCYTTFGSTCTLGCADGHVPIGHNVATCRLTNSSDVAWDIGNFTCEGKCFNCQFVFTQTLRIVLLYFFHQTRIKSKNEHRSLQVSKKEPWERFFQGSKFYAAGPNENESRFHFSST